MSEAQPLSEWEGRSADEWRGLWHCGIVRLFTQVGSTNDVAAQLATEGAPNLSIAIADEQTRGRGRSGAQWHARPGSGLLFSVLFRSPRHGGAAGCAPIRIGVAVAEAVQEVAAVETGVKWPNDVVIRGCGKLAGILCEGVFSKAGTQIVAGIGINVSQAATEFPDELRAVACSIFSATGRTIERGLLLTRIVERFHAFEDRLTERLTGEELARVRSFDVLAGKQVVCGSGANAITGVARGVREDGALLVEQSGELQPVYNATVRLARTQSFPGGAQ